MEQLVRVKETHSDGTATVLVVRESACSGDCHKCSGCGAAKETILFQANNPIGARRGDLVKVTSDTAPVLKAAAVMYMLPLLLFFGGYALGAALNISGGICGGIAFALSIVLIVRYDRRMQKSEQNIYTITALAGESALRAREKGEHDLG